VYKWEELTAIRIRTVGGVDIYHNRTRCGLNETHEIECSGKSFQSYDFLCLYT
jgi:hypothetical protein